MLDSVSYEDDTCDTGITLLSQRMVDEVPHEDDEVVRRDCAYDSRPTSSCLLFGR